MYIITLAFQSPPFQKTSTFQSTWSPSHIHLAVSNSCFLTFSHHLSLLPTPKKTNKTPPSDTHTHTHTHTRARARTLSMTAQPAEMAGGVLAGAHHGQELEADAQRCGGSDRCLLAHGANDRLRRERGDMGRQRPGKLYNQYTVQYQEAGSCSVYCFSLWNHWLSTNWMGDPNSGGGSVVCSCSIDLSSTLAGKVLTRHVLTQTQAVTAGPVENLLPEGRQIGDAVILRGPMLSALGDLM